MTERPIFASPPDGVQDVFRRARSRRRRQALLTSSGFAVVGTVAGVLLIVPGAGTGADRLSVVPASPQPGQSQTASTAAKPSPASSSTSSARGRPAAGQQPMGPPRPADAGATEASPTPYAPTRRHSAPAPITRSTVGMNPGCDPASAAEGNGWCLLYTGPQTARRKHPVQLSAELCRASIYGDGTVQFNDTRQIFFQLQEQTGAVDWTAGQGVRNRAATTNQVVRAGTCLRWTATWDTIAANGFYAPPGYYSISLGLDTAGGSTTTGADSLTLTD